MSIPPHILATVVSLLAALAAGLLFVRIGPAWDTITARQINDLSPRLQDLRLDQSELPRFLRWWGLTMVGIIAATTALGILPVGLAAAYLIFVSPRLILKARIRKRGYLLRDQMVGACVALSNATRAGLSLAQGFETIAEETPEPLATEFRRIVHDYRSGRPLSEAITHAKERLQLDSFTLFASAVLVAHERGGKVTEALDRISHSLQENQRLEKKIESDTESGRQVALILGAFPFGFLALFSLLEPEGVGLMFSTILGQIIFLVVVVLVYLSFRWCSKILTIEV